MESHTCGPSETSQQRSVGETVGTSVIDCNRRLTHQSIESKATAPQKLAGKTLPKELVLDKLDSYYDWQTVVYDFGEEKWMPPETIQQRAKTMVIRNAGVYPMPISKKAKEKYSTKCPQPDSTFMVRDA